MKNYLLILLFSLLLSHHPAIGQIPTATHITILKAEDARRYDKTLEDLLKSSNEQVRVRAALAAGRIGNDAAVPALSNLLENDASKHVRMTAAFALGEIESAKAADMILKAIRESGQTETDSRQSASAQDLTARLVEAAGKIAAANLEHAKTIELRSVILDVLDAEDKKGAKQNRETILLGLTAALRTASRDTKRERPDRTDTVVAKFLTNPDSRVRSDAANTLTRVRSKNANTVLRTMLASDREAIARANAARALGAAEDKEALNILIRAATEDVDGRVRVAAIRALATLRDAKAADPLLKRADVLLTAYKKSKKPTFIPVEYSEFLEISIALGRLLANTRDERAVSLFREFGKLDRGFSPDVYIARLRISPARGDDEKPELTHWRQYSTLAQVVGEFATLEPTNEEGKRMKSEAPGILQPLAKAYAEADPVKDADTIKAAPDVLRAYAAFKPADLSEVLRSSLTNKDVFIRATAAELIGELPSSKENTDALERALSESLRTDTKYDDAQIAILDALGKFDSLYVMRQAYQTLNAPNYLVRKKTAEVLMAKGVNEDPQMRPLDERVYPLRGYRAGDKSKLGVLLNSDADYRRALARKNGNVRAILTTQKGTFTIDLLPEEAPLTVDNFIKLARSGYFNGLEVHRVVANFVMQDGDPRGDGNGGPGWSIRCEINVVPFERGVVGMALSGKDTGGSQWFVTHSPQPHLDGGYTVFGRVNEKDMSVVDRIVRGDRIVSVRIVQAGSTQRSRRTRSKI